MAARLVDVNERERLFKSVYPILDAMVEKNEVESAVFLVVKKDGTCATMTFGMENVRESHAVIGALEVAKAGIVSDILAVTEHLQEEPL